MCLAARWKSRTDTCLALIRNYCHITNINKSSASHHLAKAWQPRLRSAEEFHYEPPTWPLQQSPKSIGSIPKIQQPNMTISDGIPGLGQGLLNTTAPKIASTHTMQRLKDSHTAKDHIVNNSTSSVAISSTIQKPRQKPSLGSGGVPEPSRSYLRQANGNPESLTSPRRILVIIDLNGTVLYRPSKKHPSRFVERPHARRFLSYCINTFSVAIWSSAKPMNVVKMVDQLLTPDLRSRCIVIWGRDKFGLTTEDYDSRVQCYKRLTRIWAEPAITKSHPEAQYGMTWDQSNTVLIDDSAEKGRSEPYNFLEIPEFSGLDNEARDVLPQVHDYLNTLSYQVDISRFMRETPFKLNTNYQLYSKDTRSKGHGSTS